MIGIKCPKCGKPRILGYACGHCGDPWRPMTLGSSARGQA